MLPCETISQIAAWKNAELQSYCCALVEAGLNRLQNETPYFGSDDVPESRQPSSHAIPGCAFSILRHAGVINDFFGTIPDDKIYNGRRKSKRELANGRKINLFQLVSVHIAEEFLRRNNIISEPIQMELTI